MKIQIDNREINVSDNNKNIVEVAKDNGIGIVAPCFNDGRKNGCCKACIIEIKGKKHFACGTKPTEGMEVIYNRNDLKVERKTAIEKYLENIKQGNQDESSCCGTDEINEESSCCSGESSCGCS